MVCSFVRSIRLKNGSSIACKVVVVHDVYCLANYYRFFSWEHISRSIKWSLKKYYCDCVCCFLGVYILCLSVYVQDLFWEYKDKWRGHGHTGKYFHLFLQYLCLLGLVVVGEIRRELVNLTIQRKIGMHRLESSCSQCNACLHIQT